MVTMGKLIWMRNMMRERNKSTHAHTHIHCRSESDIL